MVKNCSKHGNTVDKTEIKTMIILWRMVKMQLMLKAISD